MTSFFKELRNIFFSFLVNTKTIYGFRVNIDKSIIKYSQDDFHLNEKIRLLNIVEELFKYNSTKFIEDHNNNNKDLEILDIIFKCCNWDCFKRPFSKDLLN